MNKKSITYFLYLMLLISVISVGCSKRGTETAETGTQEDEAEVQEDSTADPTPAETKETGEIPVEEPVSEEDASPWTLLSETSVTTSVFFAGFLNESVGVTVGYAGAVSYTSDGGKNWSESSNVSACRYGLDFYDESFLVSCGNSGVNILSGDKGESWTYLGEFPLKSSDAYNKFLSVIDHENIYIGAPKALGVTNDGGKTWQEIEVPEECTKIAGMFFLTPEIGYLLDTDGTLFKTVDSCETWTTQTIDLSGESINQRPMPSAAINFQDENNGIIVYASKTYKLLCLKTEDGGSTWESVEMPKTSALTPYLSRDGQFLTLSAVTKKISLYKLEDK